MQWRRNFRAGAIIAGPNMSLRASFLRVGGACLSLSPNCVRIDSNFIFFGALVNIYVNISVTKNREMGRGATGDFPISQTTLNRNVNEPGARVSASAFTASGFLSNSLRLSTEALAGQCAKKILRPLTPP